MWQYWTVALKRSRAAGVVLVLTAAWLVFAVQVGISTAGPNQRFDEFWHEFQAAVRSGDIDAIASLARFPLAVHHHHDPDAVQHIERAQFDDLLPRWLDVDAGMSAEPETLRSLILRADSRTAMAMSDEGGDGVVRIAAFVFARHATGWRLMRVYDEP